MPRRNAFVVSVGVHAVMLSIALIAPLIFTDSIQVKYELVEVALVSQAVPEAALVLNLPEPLPKPQARLAPPRSQSRPLTQLARAQSRKPDAPKPEVKSAEPPEPKPAPPAPRLAGFDRPEAPAPPPKAAEVRVGMFGSSGGARTSDAPARTVQTGGFGDPDAEPAGRSERITKVASLGGFDLPGGDGGGNPRGTGRAVRSAGFSDSKPSAAEPKRNGRSEESPDTPVEITFKPRPEYTQAARDLRIEGEVPVRVLFRANGEIRVLEVLRSLGHGLDQSALRAAQQIRFKPAQRDNKSVDSTATVHIVFLLAY